MSDVFVRGIVDLNLQYLGQTSRNWTDFYEEEEEILVLGLDLGLCRR